MISKITKFSTVFALGGLLGISLSGCAPSLSTFNSMEEVVAKVEAAGFPCENPIFGSNDVYGYKEMRCYDLAGESYGFNLWPDNVTMTESTVWNESCSRKLLYGSNWDLVQGTGSQSFDLEKFARGLGGNIASIENFAGCQK